MALKLHPDKNAAPHADEAFKAVGLAYATLSDSQKRAIYDRYGDEDPDNRGGGGGGGGGGPAAHFHGQDVSPEDIFNMFFGGGMPGMHNMRGGAPGFHVYTNGFGNGFAGGGFPGTHFRHQRAQQDAAGREPVSGIGPWIQLIPLFLIMLLSFFNFNDHQQASQGQNKYFSLTVS